MNYECKITQAQPQLLASARGRANNTNIGNKIRELLDEVWAFVRGGNIPNTGQNVVVYYERTETPPLFFTEEGVPIEAGATVPAEFEGNETVVCSNAPEGRVVMTLHVGPYQKLPEAHAAIHAFSRENGLELAGTNWEVYGHMGDDPNAMETEVFYLLH